MQYCYIHLHPRVVVISRDQNTISGCIEFGGRLHERLPFEIDIERLGTSKQVEPDEFDCATGSHPG
jgi:hypothetical protein